MPLTKIRIFYLLLFLLVSAGCSGEETGAETALPEPTAALAQATEPAELPTETAVPDPPTSAPEPTNTAETESEVIAPDPTADEAIDTFPAEESQFNGNYEQTYFRGSATAAVTMIDYSDFL